MEAEEKPVAGLEFVTCEELEEQWRQDCKRLRQECEAGTKRWGNWRYNPTEPPSVDIGQYQIVLDRIDTVAKLGDWQMHMAEKMWVTPDDLGQLTKAIFDLSNIGLHSISGRGVA